MITELANTVQKSGPVTNVHAMTTTIAGIGLVTDLPAIQVCVA